MNRDQYLYTLKNEFTSICKEDCLLKEGFSKKVAQTIEKCFQKDSPFNRQQQALSILTAFWEAFSKFDFNFFLESKHLSQADARKFMAFLLRCLYFEDIDFVRLHQYPSALHDFLFQLLAETTGTRVLQRAIKGLEETELIPLIYSCCSNYREGSYTILSRIENLKNAQISSLLRGLERKYFDLELFSTFLKKNPRPTFASLAPLIDLLGTNAKHQAAALHLSFKPLVEAIIDSPVKVFDFLEKEKGSFSTHSEEGRAYAQSIKENLKNRFEFYFEKTLTPEHFEAFFKLFGLYNHQPPLKLAGNCFNHSLLEKIEAVRALFESPMSLTHTSQDELNDIYAFIYKILREMHCYHFQAHKYQQGLESVTFAMPTSNKELEKLPWLPSLLKGLNTLKAHIKKKDLKDYPIYIFDQSGEKIFSKNRRFIERLNKKYKSSILHISREKALLLSGKLGIEDLIAASPSNSFGFGGARNCVYFLAPLLRTAGKNIEEILLLSQKELQNLFSASLSADAAIHMGDDDIQIPEAGIFDDVLFAIEHQHAYFIRRTYVCGRTATEINPSIDLAEFLRNPAGLYNMTRWDSHAKINDMMGLLSKPKFCLNLPFGHEERDMAAMGDYQDFFRKAIVHLAGRRFPQEKIPVDPFDGLQESFIKTMNYVFQIGMVQSLIDPTNMKNRCVLPWNYPRTRFSSFKEALAFAGSHESKEEMQKRFWKNVDGLLQPETRRTFLTGRDLDCLEVDIDGEIEKFCGERSYLSGHASLQAIAGAYKRLQKDAGLFLTLLKSIREAISAHGQTDCSKIIEQTKEQFERENKIGIVEWPIAYGIYQLCKVVGAGQFCKSIKKIDLRSWQNE